MASMVEKLYPPVIGASVPAFYSEPYGTKGIVMKITVPFSMNRAVDVNQVAGLVLKIKTVQSNTYLADLTEIDGTLEQALTKNQVTFFWRYTNENGDICPIRYGQYLKVQLAYKSEDNVTGYFSTVATTKYTSLPNVYIKDMKDDDINMYRKSYIGVFEPTEDKSERPYSYIFNIYDRRDRKLVESSEWQLHNSDSNVNINEFSSLEEAIDRYSYSTQLTPNHEYFIEYGVKTINNLVVFSKVYECMQIEAQPPEILADLHAENNYEEGYVKLYLTTITAKYIISTGNFDANATYYKTATGNKVAEVSADKYEPNVYYIENPNYIAPYTEGSYMILRTDDKSNYDGWTLLRKTYFSEEYNYENWEFKDFTVEQGIKYVYCLQQYNDFGLYSQKLYANATGERDTMSKMAVYADFEDMFLYDGIKQLKIRYNPKVSSFKTTLMEAKIDTIGSKYPFIFKNGAVEYKEFPIGGLISYMADNSNLFMSYEQELNLINPNLRRQNTPDSQNIEYNSPTVSGVGYNYQAERKFKLRVLDWLNNGEIKLFRTPSEGNYLVRLMNVVLTPEDRVNRLVHSFSANAYEMAECNYDNLVDLGIIKINAPATSLKGYNSVRLEPLLRQMKADGTDIKMVNEEQSIYEWVEIYAQEGTKFYIGNAGNNNQVIINANNYLQLQAEGNYLQDIYIRLEDFLDEHNELDETLIEGTIVYQYNINDYIPAEFSDLQNVVIKNEVATLRGPVTNVLPDLLKDTVNSQGKVIKSVVQYLALNFEPRAILDVTASGSNNNLKLYIGNSELIRFDPLTIYHATNSNKYYQTSDITSATSLTEISNFNTNITLQYLDGNNVTQTADFAECPTINIPLQNYTSITYGAGIVLNCAFQSRINTYKNS